MRILTELQHVNTDLPDEAERINEMDNEDNIKKEIKEGKWNGYIMRKYKVSVKFVRKCRQELRNERF